jgi:hypothetical protein
MELEKEQKFYDDLVKNNDLLDKLLASGKDKKDILKEWEATEESKAVQQPPTSFYRPYLFKLQTNRVEDGKYQAIVDEFKLLENLFRKNIVKMLEMSSKLSDVFENPTAKGEQEAWLKVLKPCCDE